MTQISGITHPLSRDSLCPKYIERRVTFKNDAHVYYLIVSNTSSVFLDTLKNMISPRWTNVSKLYTREEFVKEWFNQTWKFPNSTLTKHVCTIMPFISIVPMTKSANNAVVNDIFESCVFQSTQSHAWPSWSTDQSPTSPPVKDSSKTTLTKTQKQWYNK